MKYSETDVLTIRNKQAEDAKRLINIRKAEYRMQVPYVKSVVMIWDMIVMRG